MLPKRSHLVVIVVILAVTHGLAHAKATNKIAHQTLDTDTNGGDPARLLRREHDVAMEEERTLSDFTSKLKSIFRKKPTVTTTLHRHPAIKSRENNPVIKSLERNPSIKSLANNPSKEIKLTNENIKKIGTELAKTPGLKDELKDIGIIVLSVLAAFGLAAIPVGAFMMIMGQGLNIQR
uniref:Avh117 n=1 Tax=Phytophthora sojae TaxID=67593 RepID=G1FRG0_PHYSO|nr:Avh117 [Phytophthora sojae]